jgi:hypothetical protein
MKQSAPFPGVEINFKKQKSSRNGVFAEKNPKL